MDNLISLWGASGLAQLQPGQAVMMLIGMVLLYLAIARNFEPLLLVPIGFGGILAKRLAVIIFILVHLRIDNRDSISRSLACNKQILLLSSALSCTFAQFFLLLKSFS